MATTTIRQANVADLTFAVADAADELRVTAKHGTIELHTR